MFPVSHLTVSSTIFAIQQKVNILQNRSFAHYTSRTGAGLAQAV
jgi:hypothetical protein